MAKKGQKDRNRMKRAAKKRVKQRHKRKEASKAADARLNGPRSRSSLLRAALPLLAMSSMAG